MAWNVKQFYKRVFAIRHFHSSACLSETLLARGGKKKPNAWLRGSLALGWRRLWSLTRRATHEKVSGCTKGQAGGAISKNGAGMGESLEKNLRCASIWNWFCTYLRKGSFEMHFGCISFCVFFLANFWKMFCFPLRLIPDYCFLRSPKQTKEERKAFFFSGFAFSVFSK